MVYFLCKAYDSDRQNCYFARSLPVQGAWIEMFLKGGTVMNKNRRSPCRERGLKYLPEHPPLRGGVAPRAGSVD